MRLRYTGIGNKHGVPLVISLAPWFSKKTDSIDIKEDQDLFDTDEDLETAVSLGAKVAIKHVVSFGIFCFNWELTHKESYASSRECNPVLFFSDDKEGLLDRGLHTSSLRYRHGKLRSGFVRNGDWDFLIEDGMFKIGNFSGGQFHEVCNMPVPKYQAKVVFGPNIFQPGEEVDYNQVIFEARKILEKNLWRMTWKKTMTVTVGA